MTLTGPRLLAAHDVARAGGIEERDAVRAAVRSALISHSGNRARAAEALGISLRTLLRWLALDPAITTGVEMRGPGRVTEK